MKRKEKKKKQENLKKFQYYNYFVVNYAVSSEHGLRSNVRLSQARITHVKRNEKERNN